MQPVLQPRQSIQFFSHKFGDKEPVWVEEARFFLYY